MATGRSQAQPDLWETQKDKDFQKLTCPCRSVLSSMRAQVNVWAPSGATDNTEGRGQRKVRQRSQKCNLASSIIVRREAKAKAKANSHIFFHTVVSAFMYF